MDHPQETEPGDWRQKFHVMKLLLTVPSNAVARLASVRAVIPVNSDRNILINRRIT